MKLLKSVLVLVFCLSLAAAQDWPEWRGPARDGTSPEKNLPASWSPAGQNLAWKAPYGGRSTPVVFGNRVYVQNPTIKTGEEATTGRELLQEQIVCLNADTGKALWTYKFNTYLSDAPAHRLAWASPAVDRGSGNIYVMSSGGTLFVLSPLGKLLWERSLSEEMGFLTTHGGRVVSPIVDGDLVIASGITFSWGEHGRGQHRFLAFDKKTGQTVWISNFAGRPYDTTYAPPIIATVGGLRLLIQGVSDGVVYALKPQTGELVWKTEVSKRGFNTGVLVKDNLALITHSEENLASSEMGMLLAVDAQSKGEVKLAQAKYATIGWQGGFSSPVLDGDRLYQVDNGANLAAFDANTGKQLWLQNLGTIQKASLVMGDGKLYVGTENGKFFILKPSATGCEILDQDQLGTEEKPEAILAGAAIAGGRVFVASDTAVYCIKDKKWKQSQSQRMGKQFSPANPPITHVQVYPAEVTLRPGEKLDFRARSFNQDGNSLGEMSVAWSQDGLSGVLYEGQFTAASDSVVQVGTIKATVNGVTGVARVRVIPPLPYSENFDALAPNTVPMFWTNTQLKFAAREVNGQKVMVKTTEGTSLLTRARAYFGPTDWHDYTVESDIYATERRRQQGDAGVIAQRYMLMLYGNAQKLEINSWQPETNRAATIPFVWEKNKWYRLKLTVDNLPGGKVRARGKVWAVGEPEPKGWMIEKIDPIGNRQGSPGIFGNALAEIYFDNLKVTPNR